MDLVDEIFRRFRLGLLGLVGGRRHAQHVAEQAMETTGKILSEAQLTADDNARHFVVAAPHRVVNRAERNIEHAVVHPLSDKPIHKGDWQVARINDFGALRGRQVILG
jgi:hypothetical protein